MQKASGEEDRLRHNVGQGQADSKEIELVTIVWKDGRHLDIETVETLLPPGGSFPYWMVKYTVNDSNRCTFYHENVVTSLTIIEKEN